MEIGETMVGEKCPTFSPPSSMVAPDQKGEERHPFEEIGWWYRITGKTLAKR